MITINRELGSGGRTVGEKLAAKLGVPFYDKALIKALTEKYYKVEMDKVPGLLTNEEMYKAEKEIVKAIAEEESCVIAGRTAFYIMKDQSNRLSILIQAPLEHRIQRLMTKQGLSREEAEKTIKNVDKMRENYVNKYTGTSRYDTRNYDLVIAMDRLSEDAAADLILDYINSQA